LVARVCGVRPPEESSAFQKRESCPMGMGGDEDKKDKEIKKKNKEAHYVSLKLKPGRGHGIGAESGRNAGAELSPRPGKEIFIALWPGRKPRVKSALSHHTIKSFFVH